MSAEFVFSSGAGLWSRQELVLGEEVLWGGLSGERQLSEILLYQGVRYESKSTHATHTSVQPFIELGFHLEPNMV